MIGHHTCFRENGDLLPWRGSAAKKKPPFFNARALVRALMTREIMPSKDPQCNTGELPHSRPQSSSLLRISHVIKDKSSGVVNGTI